MIRTLMLVSILMIHAPLLAADLPLPRPVHPPVTQEKPETIPRPYTYLEPAPLNLPTEESLQTVHVKDRSYTINRVGRVVFDARDKATNKDFAGARSDIDKLDQSLTLIGSGRGAVESRDRLLVENCTFVIDFTEGDFGRWDPRRGAIYVEGYREVVIRNCVFASKALASDPERKVTGSVIAYDCLKVSIDNCYFYGRTLGWRGHIIAYCCGPTEITNVEIDAGGKPAGGIWVATGVGEGKIGHMHEDQPELAIYPPGPLRVENAIVHNQKGKENADGIYVQSVQPYLIRNCRVADWGPDDSLVDVGFRDTAPKTYNGKPLINHGAVGVIERCEFEKGWIKNSVGLAGGLVFRNNLMKPGSWLFPYAFDGGTWWVVSNRFDDLNGVIVSGKNNQLSGWTPKEGMLTNGSKMVLHNNILQSTAPSKALFVAGAKPAPLKDVIVSDYNIYDVPPPKSWGIDVASTYATLDEWRAQTGNDANSVVGNGSLDQFKSNAPLKLAGGLELHWGIPEVGLTGAVGVSEAVRKKAYELRDAAEKDLTENLEARKAAEQARAQAVDDRRKAIEAASIRLDMTTVEFQNVTDSKSGVYGPEGKTYLLWMPQKEGASCHVTFEIDKPGRYTPRFRLSSQADKIDVTATMGDQQLGSATTGGELRFNAIDLTAGKQTLTLTAAKAGKIRLNELVLIPAN